MDTNTIVKDWLEPGASVRSVAKKYNVTTYFVEKCIREVYPTDNLRELKNNREEYEKKDKEIAQLYLEPGSSFNKLSRQLHVSYDRVQSAVHKYLTKEQIVKHKEELIEKGFIGGRKKRKERDKRNKQHAELEKGVVIVGPIHVPGTKDYVLRMPVPGESLIKFAKVKDRYGYYIDDYMIGR